MSHGTSGRKWPQAQMSAAPTPPRGGPTDPLSADFRHTTVGPRERLHHTTSCHGAHVLAAATAVAAAAKRCAGGSHGRRQPPTPVAASLYVASFSAPFSIKGGSPCYPPPSCAPLSGLDCYRGGAAYGTSKRRMQPPLRGIRAAGGRCLALTAAQATPGGPRIPHRRSPRGRGTVASRRPPTASQWPL